jgi:hypothetical protein
LSVTSSGNSSDVNNHRFGCNTLGINNLREGKLGGGDGGRLVDGNSEFLCDVRRKTGLKIHSSGMLTSKVKIPGSEPT